ncbi:hypothetical protein F7233_07945 [Corynebacterium sp. 321]|nr:hypothetical protein F7233_07945 [Corynebacterium sp. 321]
MHRSSKETPQPPPAAPQPPPPQQPQPPPPQPAKNQLLKTQQPVKNQPRQKTTPSHTHLAMNNPQRHNANQKNP